MLCKKSPHSYEVVGTWLNSVTYFPLQKPHPSSLFNCRGVLSIHIMSLPTGRQGEQTRAFILGTRWMKVDGLTSGFLICNIGPSMKKRKAIQKEVGEAQSYDKPVG
jgi:hypothetical protein